MGKVRLAPSLRLAFNLVIVGLFAFRLLMDSRGLPLGSGHIVTKK